VRWRRSVFPLSPDIAEERIRETARSEARDRRFTLIACRRDDDLPVGSVSIWMPNVIWAHCIFHSWPALEEGRLQHLDAEMLELVVPFLLQEQHFLAVMAEIAATSEVMIAAATRIGMRKAFHLREALFRHGCRVDLLAYEALAPRGIELFGEPPEPVFRPVERKAPAPVRRSTSTFAADPPSDAVVSGDRLYLRPITVADASAMAKMALEETENVHEPRWPRSQLLTASVHRSLGDSEPPDWLRFAICLRESGELIGANGLLDIDLVNGTAETETEIFRAEYRGAGLGTEAKHLLLDYTFDTLGLHMVRSFVWQSNPRSAAALRKQGYRECGVVTWREFSGEPRGDWVFDLLASEWRAARR
jgi:RimJ/RimL family protein N-acetyltransferase